MSTMDAKAAEPWGHKKGSYPDESIAGVLPIGVGHFG